MFTMGEYGNNLLMIPCKTSDGYGLGLMLNIDWNQPFDDTTFSQLVLCLPRTLRYKQENIGIIPGPSEPKHDINTFLQPQVKEILTSGMALK